MIRNSTNIFMVLISLLIAIVICPRETFATSWVTGELSIDLSQVKPVDIEWTITITAEPYIAFENGLLVLQLSEEQDSGFVEVYSKEVWNGDATASEPVIFHHSFPSPTTRRCILTARMIPNPSGVGGTLSFGEKLFLYVDANRLLKSSEGFVYIWLDEIQDSLIKLGLGNASMEQIKSQAPGLADSLLKLNRLRSTGSSTPKTLKTNVSPHPPSGKYDSAGWQCMGILQNLGPVYHPDDTTNSGSSAQHGDSIYPVPDSLKDHVLIPIERSMNSQEPIRSDTISYKNPGHRTANQRLEDSIHAADLRRIRELREDSIKSQDEGE